MKELEQSVFNIESNKLKIKEIKELGFAKSEIKKYQPILF